MRSLSATLALRLDELHVQLNLDNITKKTGPEVQAEVAPPDLARRLEPRMPAPVDRTSTTPPNSTASATGRVTSPMVNSPSRDQSSSFPDTRVETERHRRTASRRRADRPSAMCASRSGVARVDRGQCDGGAHPDVVHPLADVQRRPPPREASPHLRDPEVADGEVHRRVQRVERPVAGRERQCGGRSRGVVVELSLGHEPTLRSTGGREGGRAEMVVTGPRSATPTLIRSTGERQRVGHLSCAPGVKPSHPPRWGCRPGRASHPGPAPLRAGHARRDQRRVPHPARTGPRPQPVTPGPRRPRRRADPARRRSGSCSAGSSKESGHDAMLCAGAAAAPPSHGPPDRAAILDRLEPTPAVLVNWIGDVIAYTDAYEPTPAHSDPRRPTAEHRAVRLHRRARPHRVRRMGPRGRRTGRRTSGTGRRSTTRMSPRSPTS